MSTHLKSAIEFACHDESCAPPPVGTGGSKPGGVTQKAVQSAKENGGFTISVGGKVPTSGISVSLYPDRTVKVPIGVSDEVTARKIDEFIQGASDLLGKKDHYLGGWVEGGNLWIDVARVYPKTRRAAAISAGRKANQKAIWDIDAGEEIDTGGTGEAL